MRHVLFTLPKSKFPTWPHALEYLRNLGGNRYHLINSLHLPEQADRVCCFLVYNGLVRGYLQVVATGPTEDFRHLHRIGKPRKTQSLVLTAWRPYEGPVVQIQGFQGWRYTDLQP